MGGERGFVRLDTDPGGAPAQASATRERERLARPIRGARPPSDRVAAARGPGSGADRPGPWQGSLTQRVVFPPDVLDLRGSAGGASAAPAAAGSGDRGGQARRGGAGGDGPVGGRPSADSPRHAGGGGRPAAGGESPIFQSPYERARLEELRRSGAPVEVLCLDGVRVSGRLVDFDRYSLILRVEGEDWIVYKHAVMHVRPAPAAPAGAGGTDRREPPARAGVPPEPGVEPGEGGAAGTRPTAP